MTSFYPRINKYTGAPSPIYQKNNLILAGIVVFSLILFSCQEESTTIGSGLLPGTDFVEVLSTDTIPVDAYTVYIDSVYSTNRTYSYLGGRYDPYFGNTFSDFVSQLRLLKKYSGGVPVVDSVKLVIPVTGAQGEFGLQNKISLYEIKEQLSADSLYYSDRDPQAGLFFGSYLLPAIEKDTSFNIILELPVWIGEYLMRDTTKLNQEGGANDFRAFFKGIYVTIDEGTKSGMKGSVPDIRTIMALSFSTGDFRFRVYYHTISSSDLTFDFVINSNSVRYNRYLHDFTTGEPGKMIQHINDGFKDTLSYIQGFSGVFTRIKFPELEVFKSKMPLSVNKTQMIFTVFLDNDLYTTSTVPTRIYMSYTTSTGTRNLVPDYYVSPSFFDGTINTSAKTYTFNLASFAQEYLEGRIPEPVVDMYLPEGEVGNVILKTNNSPNPVKFQFVYTRF